MDTQMGYPRRMSRAAFTPDPEQRKLLAALLRAAERREAADVAYRALLAQCEQAKIPVARLAEDLKVERKTVYRHLGRKMK